MSVSPGCWITTVAGLVVLSFSPTLAQSPDKSPDLKAGAPGVDRTEAGLSRGPDQSATPKASNVSNSQSKPQAFPSGHAERPGSAQSQTLFPRSDYLPLDVERWRKGLGLIEARDFDQLWQLETNSASSTSPDAEELRLLWAKGLAARGDVLLAQMLLDGGARRQIGTGIGLESLQTLHELFVKHSLDERALEDLALDLDTTVDPVDPRSMVGFFRARALLRREMAAASRAWILDAIGLIGSSTVYESEILMDRVRQAVGRDDVSLATELLNRLEAHPAVRLPTLELVRLTRARLSFERRDYETSLRLYRQASVPVRERARAWLEMGWSYFYSRQFGRALGALEALRSAYFRSLMTPSADVLEMLIYRDLCDDSRVRELADQFLQSTAGLFTHLESRQPLRRQPVILQMALQDAGFQGRAQLIHQLRQERSRLSQDTWSEEGLRSQLIQQVRQRERQIEYEIDREVEPVLVRVANELIDLRDQVRYISYEAAIREVRSGPRASVDYEPPAPQRYQVQQLFWPVGAEAWLDELFDYQVLVRGRCTDGRTK